jgi:hypothetical protein
MSEWVCEGERTPALQSEARKLVVRRAEPNGGQKV